MAMDTSLLPCSDRGAQVNAVFTVSFYSQLPCSDRAAQVMPCLQYVFILVTVLRPCSASYARFLARLSFQKNEKIKRTVPILKSNST